MYTYSFQGYKEHFEYPSPLSFPPLKERFEIFAHFHETMERGRSGIWRENVQKLITFF